MPFKLNQVRRHRIPRQRHGVTNSAAYDAALRQRGSLTVWFTHEVIEGWRAEPRTTPDGQPWYSPLAVLTALTLRSVFRLALAVPDHSTLSRRSKMLAAGGGATGGVSVVVSGDKVQISYAGARVARHDQRRNRRERAVDAAHLRGIVAEAPGAGSVATALPLGADLLRPLLRYEQVAGGAW